MRVCDQRITSSTRDKPTTVIESDKFITLLKIEFYIRFVYGFVSKYQSAKRPSDSVN